MGPTAWNAWMDILFGRKCCSPMTVWPAYQDVSSAKAILLAINAPITSTSTAPSRSAWAAATWDIAWSAQSTGSAPSALLKPTTSARRGSVFPAAMGPISAWPAREDRATARSARRTTTPRQASVRPVPRWLRDVRNVRTGQLVWLASNPTTSWTVRHVQGA